MHYTPHNYQRQATDFIIDHDEAAIFLGMGLGKSVIALTAIWQLMLDYFTIHRVLVIAPLRVARDTWPTDVGRILRTFKIKKNVEVTDNGKIII